MSTAACGLEKADWQGGENNSSLRRAARFCSPAQLYMFEVIEVVPEPGKPQSNRKLKPVYAKPQKYDMLMPDQHSALRKNQRTDDWRGSPMEFSRTQMMFRRGCKGCSTWQSIDHALDFGYFCSGE
jgi:hypothetical protein